MLQLLQNQKPKVCTSGELIATKQDPNGKTSFYFQKEREIQGQVGNWYENNIQNITLVKGELAVITGNKILRLLVCIRKDPKYLHNPQWLLYNFGDKLNEM